jgi:hypothetical protein
LDIVIFLARWVFGPIVAVCITLLVSEPLKNWLAPVVAKLGSRKDQGISGRWIAVFSHGPQEAEYVEVIEISSLFGQLVGRVVPDKRNYPALREVDKVRPLRLRGTIKDNRYFTGIWFHPVRRSHHHGAFELLLNVDGESMDGLWLGYSETKNTIQTGRWAWRRG